MNIKPVNSILRSWSIKRVLTVGALLATANGCEDVEINGEDRRPPLNGPPATSSTCTDTSQPVPECDWTTTPIKGGSKQLRALTVHKQLHVALQVKGDVNLGGKKISATETSGFVAKLTPDGKHIWSKGCKNIESLPSIAANKDDDVVFIASAKNNNTLTTCLEHLSGNPIPAPQNLSYVHAGQGGDPQNAIDPSSLHPTLSFGDVTLLPAPRLSFIVKFDENGTYRWHQIFKGLQIRTEFDDQQNLIVSGYENGVSDECKGDECIANHDGTTEGSWFISKFSANGNRLWTKRFPTQDDASKPIDRLMHAVAPSGEIFVAASFTSIVDILNHQLESVGERDVFIVRLIPEKTDGPGGRETVKVDEMRQIVGQSDMTLTDITVAEDGLPIVIGTFKGLLEYKDDPPGDESTLSKGDKFRVFMAKPLTKSKSPVFLKLIGIMSDPSINLKPFDLMVQRDDLNDPQVYPLKSDILVSGVLKEPTDNCPLVPTSALLRYTSLGEWIEDVPVPDVNGPTPLNIDIASEGRIFIGGNLSPTCNIGVSDEDLYVGYKDIKINSDDDDP